MLTSAFPSSRHLLTSIETTISPRKGVGDILPLSHSTRSNTGLKGREVRFSNLVLTPHTTWYTSSIVSEKDKPAMIQGSKSCRFQSVSWRWLLFVKKRYIAFTGNISRNKISILLLASSTRIRRQRGDGRCRHSTETVVQHTHQLKCYRRTSQSALSHDI